jgi:arabinogalactan oligomer/maltooligosaccharide transport system substrate-binding protein
MFRRALLSLVVLAAAVTTALAQAKEIVVWHAYRGDEKAAFEKVVAEFNKAYAGKGIKATTLAVPFDAFADKITAAVPRGRGPDVFIYAQDRLGGWIEAGNTVEALDFYIDKSVKARYLPTTVEAMTYQGTTYGLPLNFKVITMIYNKKLVPRPPRTSAELVTVAKKLTDKASGRFGLAYAYSDFYYHAALMNGFGGRVFDKARNPVLNAPENVKALEQLLKWQNRDGILPAEPSSALIKSLFNEGKAGIVFSGPWFLGEIAQGIDYGLAPLPALVEAGGKPMRPWMTVEGMYVAAPSKNKQAAYELVKYATDTAATKIMALEGRQTPANKAVYADKKVASDPVLKAFFEQVKVAIPMPNVPEMTMVWSPATTAMNTIVKGSAKPKEAMDGAQRAVQADVARLRGQK